MAKYKITYDRKGCIGAASCVAVFEEMWEIDEEGKAKILLKNVKNLGNGIFEVVIEEDLLNKVRESAQVCPVNVIHIENLDTGDEII